MNLKRFLYQTCHLFEGLNCWHQMWQISLLPKWNMGTATRWQLMSQLKSLMLLKCASSFNMSMVRSQPKTFCFCHHRSKPKATKYGVLALNHTGPNVLNGSWCSKYSCLWKIISDITPTTELRLVSINALSIKLFSELLKKHNIKMALDYPETQSSV